MDTDEALAAAYNNLYSATFLVVRMKITFTPDTHKTQTAVRYLPISGLRRLDESELIRIFHKKIVRRSVCLSVCLSVRPSKKSCLFFFGPIYPTYGLQEDPLWHEASSVFSVSLRVQITRRLIFFGDPTRESGTQRSVTVKDSGTQRSVTVRDSRGQSRRLSLTVPDCP